MPFTGFQQHQLHLGGTIAVNGHRIASQQCCAEICMKAACTGSDDYYTMPSLHALHAVTSSAGVHAHLEQTATALVRCTGMLRLQGCCMQTLRARHD
jgi:hypothetical protein